MGDEGNVEESQREGAEEDKKDEESPEKESRERSCSTTFMSLLLVGDVISN